MSEYKIDVSNQAKKYLKKLKERNLKEKFLDLIYDDIAENPYTGDQKQSDLKGVYAKGFIYKKSAYRVAYKIEDAYIIPILLAGPHEKFYEQLKRLIKNR